MIMIEIHAVWGIRFNHSDYCFHQWCHLSLLLRILSWIKLVELNWIFSTECIISQYTVHDHITGTLTTQQHIRRENSQISLSEIHLCWLLTVPLLLCVNLCLDCVLLNFIQYSNTRYDIEIKLTPVSYRDRVFSNYWSECVSVL